MAPRTKELAAKLDDPSFVLESQPWWKERTNSHELFSGMYAHTYNKQLDLKVGFQLYCLTTGDCGQH